MAEHDSRMANRFEYRLILMAAIVCVVVVVAALVWPHPDQMPAIPSPGTQQKTVFKIPPKPAAVKPQSATQSSDEQAAPVKKTVIRSAVTPKPVRKVNKTLGHGYFIQAGAFQDLARARKRQAQLQKTGWNASIVNKGKRLHAVWLGPWSSRPEADRARARLMRSLKIQGFIIRQ